MQLKHLNLTTSDVSGLAAFFERFFGFKRLLERGSGAFTRRARAMDHRPMSLVGHEPTLHAWFEMNEAANRGGLLIIKASGVWRYDKDVAGSGAIKISTAPVMVCAVDFSWRYRRKFIVLVCTAAGLSK